MQPSITPMTEADELLPLLRACDLPVADVAVRPLPNGLRPTPTVPPRRSP